MKRMIVRIVQVVIVSFAVLVMTSVPAFAASTITKAQAKGIALKDAGLKDSDVIFLKAELDKGAVQSEDEQTSETPAQEPKEETESEENTESEAVAETVTVPRYEIEFYYDGTLYEYWIDSTTGSILKLEKDTEFFLNPGALPTALP